LPASCVIVFEVPREAEGKEKPMRVEAKLEEMGLVLPNPTKTPPGLVLPFSWVRVRGERAYVSGHVPPRPRWLLRGPVGKVGAEVSEQEAYAAARLTALAILASVKRALGSLDRVGAWLRVFGMVNSAPGFDRQPNVINGFSDLILELYGPEVGDHALGGGHGGTAAGDAGGDRSRDRGTWCLARHRREPSDPAYSSKIVEVEFSDVRNVSRQ
jgi:enamine deaminase RidA (YjgF/YER057c/UK114 family)